MTKVLVSFDEKLLRRIDRAARAGDKSRSSYLSDLAEADVKRRSGPGRTPAVRAALKEIDGLFDQSPAGDSTDAIRSSRDSR